MSKYILKRNLIREDGQVVAVGQALPDDISEERIEIYLKKGIIKKARVAKPAPQKDNIGE